MSVAYKKKDYIRLALDSVREYDEFGRLHVKMAHISKANVCPYYGHEIPNGEQLGLSPYKVYKLLRDPAELRKSTESWNNLPLLRKHIAHTADEPQKSDTVGSTGTDADFSNPYMDNSLVVWDGEAIALIESGDQKELSCGYAYIADMTPGEYKGESYDGVMRDIVGNHVALVEEGRAGPDVVVGDANPFLKERVMTKAVRSRKALMVQGAVSAYLKPKLAKDTKIDLAPVFNGVNAKNYDFRRKLIFNRVAKTVKGKLAKDADIADLVELLDAMSDINDSNPDPDEVDAVDTERSDVTNRPQAGKPPGGAAPVQGAPPAQQDPAAGGGGGDVVSELQQAGCPPALLQKVQAALQQAQGGGEAGGEAPTPGGGEKGPPGAGGPPAAGGGEKSDGPPGGGEKPAGPPEKKQGEDNAMEDEEDIGEDESAEELLGGEDENVDEDKDEDETLAEDEDGESASDDPTEDKLTEGGKTEGGPAKEGSGEKLSVDSKMTKQAMDAQIQKEVKKALARQNALVAAREAVRPFIGNVDVSANDSASNLYKMALEAHDIDVTGIHPSAYKAMVAMLPKPSHNAPRAKEMALDSAAIQSQSERLAGIERIKLA